MLTLESLAAGVANNDAAAALSGQEISAQVRQMRSAECPACGFHVGAPFYDGGKQPLAMIAWPASQVEAQTMPRLPLDFVRCVDCGHVFNAAFDYSNVPYSAKPNLMFNRGASWSGFIRQLREETLARVAAAPTIVEIGHGDGHFLAALAEARPAGRYIGFDPHGAQHAGASNVELRAALFDPFRHIPELKPDMIVSRHVLEHLTSPLSLLQGINFAAALLQREVQLYFEVPCIDRAVEVGRLGDFYYEHYSHFTTQSFQKMLARSQFRLEELGHGYNGEVVYAFLGTEYFADQVLRLRAATDFFCTARKSPAKISGQLDEIYRSGKRTAIWGGVGKCAAFLNAYGIDAFRFPLVVDSDEGKTGTYVPGSGQMIRPARVLKQEPVDLVIVAAQWRAKDIVAEMEKLGLDCEVLLEHEGRLVNYYTADHPYRAAARNCH